MNLIGAEMVSVISKIEAKKSNINYDIEFCKDFQHSDSDPEGDYTNETKKALEEKKKKTIKKSYRIKGSSPNKKAISVFRKTFREKLKTQLTQ